MSMLASRALTQHLDPHHLGSFDSNPVSSFPSHFAPATTSGMVSDWQAHISPACNSPANLSVDVQPLPALSVGAGGCDIRMGYATRSATGALQRNLASAEASMGGSTMFGHAAIKTGPGPVRKKRRKYGPKPEPPYTCFCGKVFKRHEHMLRHRATHDETIKYECHICGKCFQRQDVMHRHTMTHTARNRLHSKMRTTASAASSASSSSSHTMPSSLEDAKIAQEGANTRANGKQEQGRIDFERLGTEQDVLEDPLLRVGLTDCPVSPKSMCYNEDHRIAAAQLYNAVNTTRYFYPAYPGEVQPGSVLPMGDTAYPRMSSQVGMAMDHHRAPMSMSPPPSFFASPATYATDTFDAGHRPRLNVPAVYCDGYDMKPMYGSAGIQPGYGLGPSLMPQVGIESDWSEQSPSGPSVHSFASPAWSQKAELLKRDGSETEADTPSVVPRPLAVASGLRWQDHSTAYTQGSPLMALDPGHAYRAPVQEPRRGPSTTLSSANMAASSNKAESESCSKPFGLCLADRVRGPLNGGSLGIFSAPGFGDHVSSSDTRLATMQIPSPHVSHGALASPAPLAAEMSAGRGMTGLPTQASHQTGEQSWPTMLSAPETLDSGSPLTEVTGSASPKTKPTPAKAAEKQAEENV